MDGLEAPTSWWLPALAALAVGGLCVALALQPRRWFSEGGRRARERGAVAPRSPAGLSSVPVDPGTPDPARGRPR